MTLIYSDFQLQKKSRIFKQSIVINNTSTYTRFNTLYQFLDLFSSIHSPYIQRGEKILNKKIYQCPLYAILSFTLFFRSLSLYHFYNFCSNLKSNHHDHRLCPIVRCPMLSIDSRLTDWMIENYYSYCAVCMCAVNANFKK